MGTRSAILGAMMDDENEVNELSKLMWEHKKPTLTWDELLHWAEEGREAAIAIRDEHRSLAGEILLYYRR